MPAIQIHQLSYQYKGQNRLCLSDVSFEVAQGQRFGLFGPNGAGKTTLLYLMTGLLHSKTGSVKIFGSELKQGSVPGHLFGFVPQDFAFYEELTPDENLEFFGAMSGLRFSEIKKRTGELLQILGLNEHRHKKVREFSGGMKRRVNLAIGVIHQPPLLFLDEPTTGVDVQTRFAIITYLKELNAGGTTIIYTSHLLREAEEFCQHVVLLDEGKVVASEKLDILLARQDETALEGLYLKLTGKDYRD